ESASFLWTWQTCTEFGFYQSSDSSYSIFGSPLPLNFFTQMCSDVFGNETRYTAAINRQAGTNVVMTHGSLDPWHALGNVTCDPSNNCYLIKGTAHCADMLPAREEDVPDLVETRKKIEEIIGKWLAPSAPVAEKGTASPVVIETSSPNDPVESGKNRSHPTNTDARSEQEATRKEL
ncbi:hypothetical protein OSTOST_19772, partial [Ostertagia ostertagi]